jgi:hypothetical protein
MARELPEAWRAAFARLVADEGADGPTRDADGDWTLQICCSMTTDARVASRLPGPFVLVAEHVEELCDHAGPVDIETTSCLWVCEAERATLAGHDHWQAGFSAVVTLYAEDRPYREAVKLGKARLEDPANATCCEREGGHHDDEQG